MPQGYSRLDKVALQSRLWTPRILANNGRLTRWWDAGDPSTISIAASVLSIKDKVAGTTVALGGSNATTYTPTAKGAGRGILCAGSSVGTFTATGTGDHTMYFITEPQTAAITAMVMASAGNNGGGQSPLALLWFDNTRKLQLNSNATGMLIGSTAFPITTPVVASARTLSGGSQLYGYGKLEGTDTTVGTNATGIGYLFDDPNADPFSGTAYEWLYFVGRHSDFEMRQVEGYLAWKWGVQNRLVASHPYANEPPMIGK